jgi:hypothetical protein
MRARIPLLLVAVGLLLSACGGGPADVAGTPPGDEPAPEAPEPGEGEAIDPAVDREAAEAAARALLGRSEDEIDEGPDTRILRRGDEELMGTMDLRPGRRNLELDDDGTGTYVVTRVVVEVADGEPLVVE